MRVQDMNAGPMEVPSRLQILMCPRVYVVNFLRNPWIETAFLCFTNGRTKTQTPKWPFQNFIMLVGSTKGSHSGVLPGCSFTSAGHILHCIVFRRSCWVPGKWLKASFFLSKKAGPWFILLWFGGFQSWGWVHTESFMLFLSLFLHWTGLGLVALLGQKDTGVGM